MGMSLRTTPLAPLHASLGGRMVDFAGWSMPVQFTGTLAEHRAAREGAALFDVSHMQQLWLRGSGAAAALERAVPSDILGLKTGRQRYSMLLNDQGGIIDDLMVSAWEEGLFLVVNAARAAVDIPHLQNILPAGMLEVVTDRALLALQGPQAEAILAGLAPAAAAMAFMSVARLTLAGQACLVSRSGYTGEDGYEISVPAGGAIALAEALIAAGAVPAGLGARDTLRLEAGLCLYGQDIDETTSPVEADLMWAVPRRRREAGDFPGAGVIAAQLAARPGRLRVGIRPSGRAPARAGTEIADADGRVLGVITSGTFGPTLGAPVAMGYVAFGVASAGSAVTLTVRNARLPAEVAGLPFVAHRYKR